MRKEIGFPTLVLYGVGIILGAGIYSLIGIGAGMAGTALWMAFVIAMLIAMLTGLSYVELSSMFPRAAAEYVYTKKAFGNEMLSFAISWLLIVSSVIAAAVVALAFGGYLAYMIGGSPAVFAAGLILVLSLLNYIGIKESATFNNFATLVEASGLVLVIAVALLSNGHGPSPDFFRLPSTGLAGILSAVGVIYFAFLGFEYIANIAGEVKGARRLVPRALVLSLAIASLLYVLLSITVFFIATPKELAASSAPLTAAMSHVVSGSSWLISAIALFATSNTVLIILVGASRIVYGVSAQKSLPRFLSRLSSRDTPHFAIAVVGMAGALAALTGNITTVAQLTNLGVFITYFFVNAALLKLRDSRMVNKIETPRIKGVPVLAVLGAASAVIMAMLFDITVWAFEAGIVLSGLAVFFLFDRHKREQRRRLNEAQLLTAAE